jgi:NADH:ubiquinone oxidoreductase subunit H
VVRDKEDVTTMLRSLVIIVCVLFIGLTLEAGLIWLERRLLGLWQERYGPNRVGPFGLLQVLADMIKIFMKEDWLPPFADKRVFILAPAIILITALMILAVVPFAPHIVVTNMNVLSIGARVTGPALAWELVRALLGARFRDDERYRRRAEKNAEIESSA